VPLLDAASSPGTRAIPWANRGPARWATAPPPTHQPLCPMAIEQQSRHRRGSPRGVDVAFGRRNDRALHEDVPGVGEGNGVLNAGFLGQAPYDRPDVLKVRDAGPAGWVRGAYLEKHFDERTGRSRCARPSRVRVQRPARDSRAARGFPRLAPTRALTFGHLVPELADDRRQGDPRALGAARLSSAHPGSRVCYFEPPLPLLVRRSTCRPHDG
jgi:hypothetical protein